MKSALITTHANRPFYTSRMLDAAAKQCHGMIHIAGLEKTSLMDKVRQIIDIYGNHFTETKIIVNDNTPHPNNNFINCLKGFLNTDCEAFIYLEDDIILSRNGVSFLLSCVEQEHGREGFSHATPCPIEEGADVTTENLRETILTTGWASLWGMSGNRLTAERIISICPYLDKESRERARTDHSLVWDVAYNAERTKQSWYSIAPRVSRMQNVGDIGGTHRGAYTCPTWEGL